MRQVWNMTAMAMAVSALAVACGGNNQQPAPIDPTTIPGFGDIAPFLQNAPHYVVGGVHYGVMSGTLGK